MGVAEARTGWNENVMTQTGNARLTYVDASVLGGAFDDEFAAAT